MLKFPILITIFSCTLWSDWLTSIMSCIILTHYNGYNWTSLEKEDYCEKLSVLLLNETRGIHTVQGMGRGGVVVNIKWIPAFFSLLFQLLLVQSLKWVSWKVLRLKEVLRPKKLFRLKEELRPQNRSTAPLNDG